MPTQNQGYQLIEVESFEPDEMSGRHGRVHIRPTVTSGLSQALNVECSKELSDTEKYPLGTKFRIRAKLTDRQGTKFIYSSWRWPFEILS